MQIKDSWKNKLHILDKRLNAFSQGYRQNLAILGDDNEEVAYLLDNYFKSNKLPDIIYIRTSAKHIDRKGFFKGIVFSILSEYIKKEETLDNLLKFNENLLPLSVEFAKDILKRSSLPSFLDVLEFVNKFINESSRKCVFIIENFLKLRNLFPNFHQDFSKFIILQNNCMLILSDINSRDCEKALYSDLNFLFGNFEKICVDENNFLNSYVSFRNSFSDSTSSPFLISFFANILGSNAIYHDLFKQVLFKHFSADNEEGSIIRVLEETIYVKETYFFQRFMKKVNSIEDNFRNPAALIRILISISEGYIREGELASLRAFDAKSLRAKLQKLCELNYVENLGAIYKIKDPLFSFWLSHVFKFMFTVPIFDSERCGVLFRKKAQETISLFKEDFYKEKIKRVLELFGSFKNDVLWFGKDRYKLPLIEKSRLVSYPQTRMHFLIGEGREIVFVGIKEGHAEDTDMFDFIEKGSAIKGKNVKKIFISLDLFSSSAKLIAKDNKFIAWDINEVNNLCRAYNKPIVSLSETIERAFNNENSGHL
ncbi:MAG: hypothetical protein WC412_01160 [Candidatus Omnitrophota bacterium]|jgi:hypothetical protein